MINLFSDQPYALNLHSISTLNDVASKVPRHEEYAGPFHVVGLAESFFGRDGSK